MSVCLSLLVLSSSFPINTTISDSSEVVFIMQTPVSFDTVAYDSLDFLRFTDITVTDSIGYPEVPMITCYVAVPDSVTPQLEWSVTGEEEQRGLPVYPAPRQVVSSGYIRCVVEEFVQDSAAYASSQWWPSDRVRIIGETRICDQRLVQVQVFPVQYRSIDRLRSTVSSVSVALTFDSTAARWSTIGLGPFQDMVEGSNVLGYHRRSPVDSPDPQYFTNFNIVTGPQRMPDYLIITASGLYTQCGDAIDDLAEHRVDLNDFDVALVTTDQILSAFGSGAPYITPDIIRDFTEHVWKNWGSGIKKPSYLLLIGDHEYAAGYHDEPWFLPTHEYESTKADYPVPDLIGNDEWYVYFSQPREVDNAYPEMMVGRLSVKNAEEVDTLSVMIGNIIRMEQPITGTPLEDNRRRIVRLAGTGEEDDHHVQFYYNWSPQKEWTEELCDWLGYDYATHYCGDGRWWTSQDESELMSIEFRNSCLDEFSDGAGVLFYSDHGDFHMFSAGLEWDWNYCGDYSMGARDSTFNNYQVSNSLSPSQYHAAPFVLMLCCGAGTFNHTLLRHQSHAGDYPRLCSYTGAPGWPAYDFGTDCLGEAVLKDIDCPVAGVFCGALSSYISCYDAYGCGILEAIYQRGQGRLGNSIADARLQNLDYFTAESGGFNEALGQFNLLGDPALDITDRVRYPGKCDLVVFAGEQVCSEYPRETAGGFVDDMWFTVRNNGGSPSGAFDLRVTVSDGHNSTVEDIPCASLVQGSEVTCHYEWTASWFSPPSLLTVTVHADPTSQCDDSWIYNNNASMELQLNDIYPLEEGWPIGTEMVVGTVPLLVNLDTDPELEVAAVAGTRLTAWDHEGTMLWINEEYPVSPGHPLAADFDGDGRMEIAAVNYGHSTVLLFEGDGSLLGNAGSIPGVRTIAAADMDSSTGIELATASGGTITLYEWDTDHFSQLDSKTFHYSEVPTYGAISCNDLNSDGYAETVFSSGWTGPGDPPPPAFYSLAVYDWNSQQVLSDQTWWDSSGVWIPQSAPCSGVLAETPLIGFPLQKFDVSQPSTYPAFLVAPDGTVDLCERSGASSNNLKYGMFADWDPFTTGADAFVLPSETQCLAWNNDGDPISSWPIYFDDIELGSHVCPAALGNLDGAGNADVITGTVLDNNWQALAYNSGGYELQSLGFPFIFPDGLYGLEGFAIADIDRDGNVEVVFGSSDGYLHCWELGSCSPGYSPWPQFQHDSGRSGVLE